ncbi:MAG: DegV family protein [Coriobacteriia bacterium]|nr:DegV family protein [Coriobacteriia bacterium]
MPAVGIVTDSTCDLPLEILAGLNVTMVPLTVHFGDEHVRDWIDLDPKAFYPKLASFSALPTTSQPSPADFTAAYEALAASGVEEIVSIHLSAALSGTYESAMLAAKTSPVPVRVVDGKKASQATALMVKAAVEVRDAGGEAAAIEARALAVSAECRLFFLLDTLDNLVKGGRAGKAAGLAASLLNIKPVLRVNDDGIIEPFKKVRGRQQAIAALAEHVASDTKANGRMRIALLHACTPTAADELRAAITAAGADVAWEADGEIGAVIGVYTGPGTLGCTYYPAS